jgi:hypothetical protein
MRTPCMEISPSASSLMRMVGPFSERARGGRAMIEYFHTGQYIADTAAQAEVFDVPTLEDKLRRYVAEAGLTAAAR